MLMTNGAERLLANIRELAPAITSRAAEIEAGRRMPPDLVQALRSIGIFRIFVPQSHGGLELDMPTALEILGALSRIDGSVGWTAMIGGGCDLFAPLLPRDTYGDGRGGGWRLAGQRALAVCQRLPACQLDVSDLRHD
jgi:alkylation response protein AidB-like acyl-CoA dehydrogenase